MKMVKKLHISNIQIYIDNLMLCFYSTLFHIRPAQLCDFVKKCLCVHRRYIKTNTGHKFWIDPVSSFGLQFLRKEIHEPIVVELLKSVLCKGDIFVDVGGGEGYFSVLASSLVSSGKVYCIEPQSRMQSVICENIRINNAYSVSLHRVAFLDKCGKRKLFLHPSSIPGSSSLYSYWRLVWAFEIVSVITMDVFFKKYSIGHASLLKIDCEGAENLIIIGGQNTLKRKIVDFIALMYHPAICGIDECIRTHEKLKQVGYILTKIQSLRVYHLPGLERKLQPLGKLKINCDWND